MITCFCPKTFKFTVLKLMKVLISLTYIPYIHSLSRKTQR